MSNAPASQVNFFGHSKNKIRDTDLFCSSMLQHVSFKKTLQKIQTESLHKHKQVLQQELCFPDTGQSEVLHIKLRLQVSLDPSASTKVRMTHDNDVYESFERSMDVTQTNLIGNIPVAEHGTCVSVSIIFNGRTVPADQYIVCVQEADDTFSTTSVHNNSFTLENNPQKIVLSVNFANI